MRGSPDAKMPRSPDAHWPSATATSKRTRHIFRSGGERIVALAGPALCSLPVIDCTDPLDSLAEHSGAGGYFVTVFEQALRAPRRLTVCVSVARIFSKQLTAGFCKGRLGQPVSSLQAAHCYLKLEERLHGVPGPRVPFTQHAWLLQKQEP